MKVKKTFFSKGDLSINVLIVAIIGLIVLTILVAVFGTKIGSWLGLVKNVEEPRCSDLGGMVVSMAESCPPNTADSIGTYKDVSPVAKCCVPVTRTGGN
ncbi:MAG: hypothetical protein QW594_03655 [Candidatus Woesearchaeota archaeon]